MRPATRPEPVREPEEVFLVDRVQDRGRCTLDQLVFQGGDRKRTLPTVRLGDVPAGMALPDTLPGEAASTGPQDYAQGLPRSPTMSPHPHRARLVLKFEERLLEQIEIEMVGERSELLLLPFLCDFPNAVQRLGHAFPVLCPARVSLCRLPLGPYPCSTDAASRPALFTSFTATMAESDFPRPCIIGYGSSPSRCVPGFWRLVRRGISRFPCNELPHMPGSSTTPGRLGARVHAPIRVAFRIATASAPGITIFARLNGWPVRSPTDASPPSLRTTAHGSGPMWLATPSSCRTCTDYSLPVSRRTAKEFWTLPFAHRPQRLPGPRYRCGVARLEKAPRRSFPGCQRLGSVPPTRRRAAVLNTRSIAVGSVLAIKLHDSAG